MLITGFSLAQKVSVVELFSEITSTSIVAICIVYPALAAFKCLKSEMYCRKKSVNHSPYVLLTAFNLSVVLLSGVLLLWLIWLVLSPWKVFWSMS